ncbi:Hypothetical protein A7982_06931 [Minicystis rosea]|nr:Hypothetical protein A7982_06931 [Minicystis rosea]
MVMPYPAASACPLVRGEPGIRSLARGFEPWTERGASVAMRAPEDAPPMAANAVSVTTIGKMS